MGHNTGNQLINEIEMSKKQLIKVVQQYQSLFHEKVVKKSQELDNLITQYYEYKSH